MARIYSFIRKYRPKKIKDIVGQEEAVKKALEYVKHYKPGGKPLFLYGPPGTGKTSIAYALAGELNYEIVEVNASNLRDALSLRRTIGEAMKQKSFFKKGKIILIDEVDGMSGRYDRGGIKELQKLISKSVYPVIITANDPWDNSLRELRNNSILVEVKRLRPSAIKQKLKEICEKEGIKVDDNVLNRLSRGSGGDLRAAINDLETLGYGKKEIKEEDLKVLGWREREIEVFEALGRVLQGTSIETTLTAYEYLDMDPKEIMLWLEENLPYRYTKKEDLANAMKALSIADVFMGRIIRSQHYRLLVYASTFMSSGVALAKKEKYPGFFKIHKPTRVLEMWMNKQKNEKMNYLIEHLKKKLHLSSGRTKKDVIPYIKPLLRKDDFKRKLAKWINVGVDELP